MNRKYTSNPITATGCSGKKDLSRYSVTKKGGNIPVTTTNRCTQGPLIHRQQLSEKVAVTLVITKKGCGQGLLEGRHQLLGRWQWTSGVSLAITISCSVHNTHGLLLRRCRGSLAFKLSCLFSFYLA